MAPSKIDLMIIGAQKAGSTSLAEYLAEHPRLRSALAMEFSYFLNPVERKQGIDRVMDMNFPGTGASDELKLAKMSNLYCSPEGLKLLFDHNPQCLLVFVVRDPALRAYSAYQMACYDGWLDFSPDNFLEIFHRDERDELHELFFGYGKYSSKLKDVFDVFPADQVMVFRFEDLKNDPKSVCGCIFNRLGIGRIDLVRVANVHNRTTMARSTRAAKIINTIRVRGGTIKNILKWSMPYAWYLKLGSFILDLNRSRFAFPPMDERTKLELARYYRPFDMELSEMTGLDLSGWTSMQSAPVKEGQ